MTATPTDARLTAARLGEAVMAAEAAADAVWGSPAAAAPAAPPAPDASEGDDSSDEVLRCTAPSRPLSYRSVDTGWP